MLTLPPAVQIRVCAVPVDMRKSFDGLAGAVRSLLQAEPLSGHLFVFFNRRGDHVRILYWDRNGYCLVCKRLERGVFRLPWRDLKPKPSHLELAPAELALILDGIDLKGARQRPRWTPKVSTEGNINPCDRH